MAGSKWETGCLGWMVRQNDSPRCQPISAFTHATHIGENLAICHTRSVLKQQSHATDGQRGAVIDGQRGAVIACPLLAQVHVRTSQELTSRLHIVRRRRRYRHVPQRSCVQGPIGPGGCQHQARVLPGGRYERDHSCEGASALMSVTVGHGLPRQALCSGRRSNIHSTLNCVQIRRRTHCRHNFDNFDSEFSRVRGE